MVTSGLLQDSWNTTLLPHHQSEGKTHLAVLTPNYALNAKASREPSQSLSLLSMSYPFSLLDPITNLFVHQTPKFQFVGLCARHMNLGFTIPSTHTAPLSQYQNKQNRSIHNVTYKSFKRILIFSKSNQVEY